MKNPFKVGDKVVTKVRGAQVEGVVTKLWQNEVQVRTPDNELRWRTVYTVWYPGQAPLQHGQKESGSNNSKPSIASAQPQAKKAGRSKTKESAKRSRKRH